MKTDGSDFERKNANARQAQDDGSIRGWLLKNAAQIKNALPAVITPERFTRIALTAVSKNPDLAQCEPLTLIGALFTAAQLGLECNTPLGQAFLIPRKNKRGIMEASFQLGYQGLIELCYRTKKYRVIQARVVYEGDEFSYEFGYDEVLKHVPKGKSEKPTHVYAYYQTVDGGRAFDVMTWNQAVSFGKKYSDAFRLDKQTPWKSDPEGMAKKTVLKQVLKYAPKAVEVADAITRDSAAISVSSQLDESGESFLATEVIPDAIEDGNENEAELPSPQSRAWQAFERPQAVRQENGGASDGEYPPEEVPLQAPARQGATRQRRAASAADLF